jgi:uncharacterized protein (TIGR02246 family)
LKSWYPAGIAMGISLLMTGCSSTPPPAPDTRAADEKAIRDGEIQWNADFKARDADKLVNHYADDATVMVAGVALAKGKEAIGAAVKGFLGDKNFAVNCATATVEVAKSGDLAYSRGTCTTSMSDRKTGKPINETDNYVTVYKKEAGGFWKAIEDIDTPDAPPAAPAPVKRAAKGKAAKRRK